MPLVLLKRSGQSSPYSNSQIDYNWAAIESYVNNLPSGSGSVTSVAVANISGLATSSGGPVTTAGTITLTLNSQSANLFFASPNGSSGTPSFRAMALADLGFTITVAKGGTGSTSQTASRLVTTDGSGNIVSSLGVTSTEAGYLSGVSSPIQPQLNSKQATITVLGISNGGTGASTAATARVALLPSYTGNALKYLRVNAGATDVEWATVSASVTSVNTLTGALTITPGTAGTDVTVSPSGTTITLNIPSASATARGLVTIAAQTIAGQKSFTTTPIITALTAGRVIFSGASKELVDNAALTYNATDGYLTADAIAETKITTYVTDHTLTIADSYVRSEQLAPITFTLPDINDIPTGYYFTIKDSLQNASTRNITVDAAGADVLEGVAGGSVTLSTDGAAVSIRKVEDSGGAFYYEIFSSHGTVG